MPVAVRLAFCSAAGLAGAAVGAIFGVVGQLLNLWHVAATVRVLLVTALFIIGLFQLSGIRWLPQRDRETPRSWVTWKPLPWAVGTGALLGTGVATRIGYSIWYLIPAAIVLSGSPVLGATALGVYGVARVSLSFAVFGASGPGVGIAPNMCQSDRVRALLFNRGEALRRAIAVTTVAIAALDCFPSVLP